MKAHSLIPFLARRSLALWSLAFLLGLPVAVSGIGVKTTPALASVSITATRPDTSEPSPLSRAKIAPGIFTVSRSGILEHAFTVFLSYEGTAIAGQDYEPLPASVTFQEGMTETNLFVQALDDAFVEGNETVIAQLNYGPIAGVPPYAIAVDHSAAQVVIHDNDSGIGATLHITEPVAGAVIPVGTAIEIHATAIDPNGYISRVEFYDQSTRIGVSEISFLVPPPAGTPIKHSFLWKEPPAGAHVLTAMATTSSGKPISSEPVPITVLQDVPDVAVVRIRALDPEATEISRILPAIDSARFEITRDGPTNTPIPVFFSLQGFASLGADYKVVPSSPIQLPAGVRSAQITISPLPDNLDERMETVVAQLEPAPILGPRALYNIDPQNAHATAVIYDRVRPEGGQIEIVLPASGSEFPQETPIYFEAAAFHPSVALASVTFYADETQLGSSVVPHTSDSGQLYIHRFTWQHPTPGRHVITARATLPGGTVLISNKVEVIVGGDPNPKARINITSPANGATFGAGAYIPIQAVAIDPNGYIPRVAFQVDGRVIGVSEIAFIQAPEPGTPITHSIIWTNAQAGTHILTATGIDSEGHSIVSPPVTVVIQPVGISVILGQPRDGSVYNSGQVIPILVLTRSTSTLHRIEVYADDQLLARGLPPTLTFGWSNAPAGEHTLRAVLLIPNSEAPEYTSQPVRILVRDNPEGGFVRRELPPAYSPGGSLTVTLRAQPFPGKQAWAVQEEPPKGWPITRITGEGVVDPTTGAIKFGPFTDSMARSLTYELKAPANATGPKEFGGTSSADGTAFPIEGDRLITATGQIHPADRNRDMRINIAEVTAYAAAWKSQAAWPVSPSPIPMQFLTRAAMLWRFGEAYYYAPIAGAPPACWVSDTPSTQVVALAVSSAIRSMSMPSEGGSTDGMKIALALRPAAGVVSYAVEEETPAGWTVRDVSDGGTFSNGVVRWGLFLDRDARTLSYTLKSSGDSNGLAIIRGTASFDGNAIPVSGISQVTPPNPSDLPRLSFTARESNGAVHLNLTGAAGQLCTLQSSEDLSHWTGLEMLFLPDGELEYVDVAGGTNQHRYYRLLIP